jgi:hypothetical protein
MLTPRKPKKPRKPTLPKTDEQVAWVLYQLFTVYGVPLPPYRSPGDFRLYCTEVFHHAVRDGLLRLQLNRTGPRAKRIGEYGRDLVDAVEGLQAKALQAGTPLSNVKALKQLQEQDRKKWGNDFRTLEKAFYEAKKRWFFTRKLEKFFEDPEIKRRGPRN